MAMGSSRGSGPMSDINVTPLVDVMLVLLIIFMVTAPLMQRGVQVELPRANAGSISYDEKQLMITVTANGRIQLQDQSLTLSELREKLSALRENNPNVEVFLSGDRSVRYEAVVQTIAAVKAAGITKLGMVTDPADLPGGTKSKR